MHNVTLGSREGQGDFWGNFSKKSLFILFWSLCNLRLIYSTDMM